MRRGRPPPKGRWPPAAAAPSPGDEFDRRLGAKSFGGGSSDDEDGGGSDDEDEDEEALPELDSDDIVAEAESGARGASAPAPSRPAIMPLVARPQRPGPMRPQRRINNCPAAFPRR